MDFGVGTVVVVTINNDVWSPASLTGPTIPSSEGPFARHCCGLRRREGLVRSCLCAFPVILLLVLILVLALTLPLSEVSCNAVFEGLLVAFTVELNTVSD